MIVIVTTFIVGGSFRVWLQFKLQRFAFTIVKTYTNAVITAAGRKS